MNVWGARERGVMSGSMGWFRAMVWSLDCRCFGIWHNGRVVRRGYPRIAFLITRYLLATSRATGTR